jgi:SAM-dependent methyltransferase
VLPQCERTDLFESLGADRTENAYALSMPDASVANLILVHVFHHLQYPGSALQEFQRVLAPGGRVLLFEPALSLLGLLVYGPLHHEGLGLLRRIEWTAPPVFAPRAAPYYTAQGNAHRIFLGGAFAERLRGFRVSVKRYPALSYVASGGFRGPQLFPSALYPWLRRIETRLQAPKWLFATRMLVILEKIG